MNRPRKTEEEGRGEMGHCLKGSVHGCLRAGSFNKIKDFFPPMRPFNYIMAYRIWFS
jgi:hypothetical protein